MESTVEFFNLIIDNMNNFADNTDTYWERAVIWLSIAWLDIKLRMLEFAYGIAYTIIDSAGISEAITQAWGGIPGDMLSVFSFLRIPESINMILTAYLTRFILDMIP